ncbi:MAG: cobalt ECF transporter T component CbiQ [Pseudomonadota bacterium]
MGADRLLDLGAQERLAAQDSVIHRLDPRAKILATAAFVLAVTSFGPYALVVLLPFLAYPLFLALAGGVPLGGLLKRVALVLPFALLLGLFNPLLDPAPRVWLAGVAISGGWLSFASIALRALLTASAALVLLAVTGFAPLCAGLGRLGVPRVLVTQLLFLHRYAFLLVDEVGRLRRAQAQRSAGRRPDLHTFGAMLGQLLLRTLDRAQRIHVAMLCRGFDGALPAPRPLAARPADALFLAAWCAVFALLRLAPFAHLAGDLTP